MGGDKFNEFKVDLTKQVFFGSGPNDPSGPFPLMFELLIATLLSPFASGFVFFFAMVGQTLNVDIPLQAYFFVVPVGLVAMAAPISPAGIGVGQAAFLALFNMYLGYNSTVGPTAATANQIIMLMWGLFGSIFYFRRKKPQLTPA